MVRYGLILAIRILIPEGRAIAQAGQNNGQIKVLFSRPKDILKQEENKKI